MSKDQPRTGDGRTRGKPLGELNVAVRRGSGAVMKGETVKLWGRKGKPAPEMPSRPARTEPPAKRDSWFGWVRGK